ncbi:TonB-dependent receptor [Altererythrobacter sp. ZODW24]|uniref:TonB-dependent receptor plug domain-containing protein n=1 Tax=Altererythrobacter sp. ZODW24 TaxID=2185142 RepID=UPI000DF7356D|nr:TonB-dependent receptor [Altererythrobacter sp. ZODW24]
MYRYLLATTAIPVALMAAPAVAQNAGEGVGPNAGGDEAEIVVVGEGLEPTPAEPAYAATELDREQIVSAPSGRIEDVLSSVAGFQQFRRSDSRSSNPSAQGVTLRALGGNATSRALVLLDGVPMADPFFGYIPLTALAPERLGNIRVTRGGGSGPFGAGALAGTIELQSADAATLSPVSGSLLVNDRGETEASAALTQKLGAGFVTVSGRWDRGQGFFTTPEDQRAAITSRAEFESRSAQIRAVVPVSDTLELQARGLVFDDHRTLRFDGADSTSSGQDASIRLVGRGDWQFDALAYVQARNFSNVVISSTRFVRVLDQRNTPSTGVGGKLELRPPVGPNHVLKIGTDYRRSSGELQEEAYSAFTGNLRSRRRAGGANSDLGFFIEDDWSIGRLVLTGGLRADRTTITDGFYLERQADDSISRDDTYEDRSDWTVTYRAGALYRASDALALRAAAYSGLRLPTLNELYRPFVIFPLVTEANAELDVEKLEGFEAGFDLTPREGVSFSLTAFENRVEGAIANVTLAANLRQRQNLDAIKARGIEAGAEVELGQFRFNGSLAYTDAEVEGTGFASTLSSNRPPQTPEWAGSATLAWLPADGWQLAATVRHIGAQFESDQETDRLPAATTLGAFAEVPLGGEFSLVLRGENLTGETIVTRNAGGVLDLGAPRTVWAGIRFGY